MYDFINQHEICQNKLKFNWEDVEFFNNGLRLIGNMPMFISFILFQILNTKVCDIIMLNILIARIYIYFIINYENNATSAASFIVVIMTRAKLVL